NPSRMDVDPKLTLPLAAGATPPGFRPHALELTWNLRAARAVVWAWLNDPKTFTRGQLPPFRVEFLPMPDGRPGGFEPGCLNAHHGPLMSFHGVIGEVRAPEYRDLIYGYGSYAVSMRVARPRRLQFWFEEVEPGRSVLRMRLDTDVRRGFGALWGGVNRFFWWNFGLSARLILAFRAWRG
ncbi:MAG: hypothetical protein P8R43_00970, partial [Planctomycetota bacterium]|nr:hypothetical protein [Planctomycetota bacterium]